jgi:hypothetical protein
MNVFLLLSTLSIAFYLVLLTALSADGRKHRRSHVKALRRTRSNGPLRSVEDFEAGWKEARPLSVPSKRLRVSDGRAPAKPAARSAANTNQVIIPFVSVPAKGN